MNNPDERSGSLLDPKPARRLAGAYILTGVVMIIVKAAELYTGETVSLLPYDFSYVRSGLGVLAGGLYVAAGGWLWPRTLDDLNMGVLLGPLLAILTASILNLP